MEETKDVSMKSVAIKYGVIGGLIGIIFFVIQDFAGLAGDPDFGWVSMVISIAITAVIIALAQKEYKANGDQFMNYGEGLGLGTLLSVVSGLLSSVFTYVYVSFINPTFVENIRQQQIVAMEEKGLSDAEIEQGMKMAENFSGPTALFIFGLLGAVFFGFLISLVVSAFLKKSRPEFE
ncbi:MAG: DUF4199 domain-containing protein [Marinoscillum sp.]